MRAPTDQVHFYEIFDEYAEQFQTAQTYLEFCALIGSDFLKSYVWAPPVFATAKAGKRTFHALALPLASTFEDLFSAARYLPSDGDEAKAAKRLGFVYIGSPNHSAVPHGHVGGVRGYSKTDATIHSHYGAKWYCTLVQANVETTNFVQPYFGRGAASFEAIRRDDGVLIIARDSLYIGSTWLALLNQNATIDALFSEADRQLLAREKQAEFDAWGAKS